MVDEDGVQCARAKPERYGSVHEGNKNIMQRSLNCLRSKVKKINYQFDERYV